MRTDDIRVGDVLRLKRNNVYGLGDMTRTVREIREKRGYKSVWIISTQPNGAPVESVTFLKVLPEITE